MEKHGDMKQGTQDVEEEDVTQIKDEGRNGDMNHKNGDGDMNHMVGDGDMNHKNEDGDMNHMVGDGDMNHKNEDGDMNHMLGDGDMKHKNGDGDMYHKVGENYQAKELRTVGFEERIIDEGFGEMQKASNVNEGVKMRGRQQDSRHRKTRDGDMNHKGGDMNHKGGDGNMREVDDLLGRAFRSSRKCEVGFIGMKCFVDGIGMCDAKESQRLCAETRDWLIGHLTDVCLGHMWNRDTCWVTIKGPTAKDDRCKACCTTDNNNNNNNNNNNDNNDNNNNDDNKNNDDDKVVHEKTDIKPSVFSDSLFVDTVPKLSNDESSYYVECRIVGETSHEDEWVFVSVMEKLSKMNGSLTFQFCDEDGDFLARQVAKDRDPTQSDDDGNSGEENDEVVVERSSQMEEDDCFASTRMLSGDIEGSNIWVDNDYVRSAFTPILPNSAFVLLRGGKYYLVYGEFVTPRLMHRLRLGSVPETPQIKQWLETRWEFAREIASRSLSCTCVCEKCHVCERSCVCGLTAFPKTEKGKFDSEMLGQGLVAVCLPIELAYLCVQFPTLVNQALACLPTGSDKDINADSGPEEENEGIEERRRREAFSVPGDLVVLAGKLSTGRECIPDPDDDVVEDTHSYVGICRRVCLYPSDLPEGVSSYETVLFPLRLSMVAKARLDIVNDNTELPEVPPTYCVMPNTTTNKEDIRRTADFSQIIREAQRNGAKILKGFVMLLNGLFHKGILGGGLPAVCACADKHDRQKHNQSTARTFFFDIKLLSQFFLEDNVKGEKKIEDDDATVHGDRGLKGGGDLERSADRDIVADYERRMEIEKTQREKVRRARENFDRVCAHVHHRGLKCETPRPLFYDMFCLNYLRARRLYDSDRTAFYSRFSQMVRTHVSVANFMSLRPAEKDSGHGFTVVRRDDVTSFDWYKLVLKRYRRPIFALDQINRYWDLAMDGLAEETARGQTEGTAGGQTEETACGQTDEKTLRGETDEKTARGETDEKTARGETEATAAVSGSKDTSTARRSQGETDTAREGDGKTGTGKKASTSVECTGPRIEEETESVVETETTTNASKGAEKAEATGRSVEGVETSSTSGYIVVTTSSSHTTNSGKTSAATTEASCSSFAPLLHPPSEGWRLSPGSSRKVMASSPEFVAGRLNESSSLYDDTMVDSSDEEENSFSPVEKDLLSSTSPEILDGLQSSQAWKESFEDEDEEFAKYLIAKNNYQTDSTSSALEALAEMMIEEIGKAQKIHTNMRDDQQCDSAKSELRQHGGGAHGGGTRASSLTSAGSRATPTGLPVIDEQTTTEDHQQ